MRFPFSCLLLAAPLACQDPGDDAARLAAACNRFAAELHARLAAAGNPTCAPASVAIALAMLVPGARSTTADELAAVLHLPDDLRDARLVTAARQLLTAVGLVQQGGRERTVAGHPLLITNDLWVQRGLPIEALFTTSLRDGFGASAHEVDFADGDTARARINAHVARATNDRIRDLLAPGTVTPLTRAVLTNALWFRARWAHTFYDGATTDAPFTLADGTQVAVPTMRQTEHFIYAESAAWQCLTMAFERSRLQCEIVLPRAGARLEAVERDLLAGKPAVAGKAERVRVALPRFQVTAAHQLAEVLTGLGMRTAFDVEHADFGGITAAERISLSNVIHRTWIAVDEDGAEAAAATAGVLAAGAAMPEGEPKEFTADRPFAFVIRDRTTGLVLFTGRVEDPRRRGA